MTSVTISDAAYTVTFEILHSKNYPLESNLMLPREISILILLSVLAGCKLQIVVPVGGTVTTASGTYTCLAGEVCEIDVVDLLFDETFIAEPDSGYEFLEWKKKAGGRGFCATESSRQSPCRLYTSFFANWPNLFAFLATDDVFYLEPAFMLEPAPITAIYVSPDGDDANDGSLATPLKTFEGARNKVRILIDGTSDITVYFRAGTYVFDQTVTLGTQDSGSASQSITYAAYPGETPVFTSLVQVTGWTPHSGNLMVADLPSGITHIRYLHDENESWLKQSSTAYFRPDIVASCGGAECEHWEPGAQVRKTYTIYPATFSMPDTSKAAQYDLRCHMTAWNAQVLPVTSIDTNTRTINVGTPSHYSLVDGIDDLRTECWILNSLDGIDVAGEWASLDGKVYFWPVSGTGDIYAPALKELIRIDAGGDGNTWSGTPVQYIHFEGITFTGTDYRISESTDVMAQHDWQMVDVPEGMLRFRNAENSSVKNCTFTKGGADAVRLDRYAQNIVIDNNTFSYLGKGAVLASGRGPGYGDVNKGNTITSNHFKQTSRIKWDAAAVHLDQSSSNLIKQNYFENIPLSAIVISGNRESNIAEAEAAPINRDFHFAEIRPDLIENWEGSSAHFYDYDNLVEENTFRAVHIGTPELIPAVNASAPGFTNGMIYTTGRQSGGKDSIRKNYFYDVNAQTTFSHTWVLLGDGHEDYLDFSQNMAYNLKQTNGFEDPPFMSNNCSVTGGCSAMANVKLNSAYSSMECAVCQNTNYAGNIDFDAGTPSGSASYVTQYQEMWSLLCPGNMPGPNPLPGAEELQASLATTINAFGGAVPTCRN
ncbi:MAG: right-handed parallel beta-helix repeat-containing protein [Halieaceae bacterium]|nr:right-handed parallel beta-helix repeat-containing protein [Halieaceae bacterium]